MDNARAPAGAAATRGAALRAAKAKEHALHQQQRKQAIASAQRARPRAKRSRADEEDEEEEDSSCWHPIANGSCVLC